MKREPTLADLLLVSDSGLAPPKWHARKVDHLRLAKKFVFDNQATRYLAEMIRDNPRLIADAQDYVIPAFERMWIEMNQKVLWQIINPPELWKPEMDTRVGFLITGPTVVVGSHDEQKHAYFNPFEYTLHKPMSLEDQLRFVSETKISRVQIDVFFWGASYDHLQTQDHPEYEASRRTLRACHSVERITSPFVPASKAGRFGVNWNMMIGECTGDLRNIVSTLIFLNRTANITYQRDVGMSRSLIRRKLSPLMPHRVITLKLDPKPRLQKLSVGLSVRRRLHDVRGHFCHDRKARAGCPHGQEYDGDFGEWWEEYDVLQWRCTHCGGKRWWRHEHRRGDPKIGVVSQSYAVTR